MAGLWNEGLFTSTKIPAAIIKEASMVMQPIAPPTDLGIFLHPMPLIRKPIKGKSGIKYTS
jgi:hypothetical protein